MALPVFPTTIRNPSSISPRQTIFAIKKTSFGEGFNKRLIDGINNIRKNFTLNWELLSNSEVKILNDFLDLQAGSNPFLWVDPVTLETFRVVSDDSLRETNQAIFTNFTVTFIQDFGLDV